MTTQTPSVETPSTELELSDPKALVTGRPLPTKDHLFRTPDGTKVKVRLRGLTYARKSELDAQARIEREESERTGVAKSDLRGPLLIARAACNPDGSKRFGTYEDEMAFAIALSEQMADGEISRGYNAVLELSGYGDEAMDTAGKS